MADKKFKTPVQISGSSAERSLRLLARLAEDGRAISLADLSADLALPKGTVHRLCMQLIESSFIARDVNERDYVIGPALKKLALDTLNHSTVLSLRHQVLTELVAQIAETCNITVLDGAAVLYLDRVEAPWPWRLTLAVGEHVPLHCTASGKLLLALAPKKQRDLLISQLQLTAMTKATITTIAALQQECAAVAAAGYSIDRQEFIDGLLAVAVPVRNEGGKVCAGLAVHAPISRMPLEQAMAKLPALQAAALRLGKLM